MADWLVEALERRLSSNDPTTRELAARALGDLGSPARPTVTALARASLEDPESRVRASAVTALHRIGASPQDLRENAVACLEHPDGPVRARAGWALGKLGPDALPAVRELSAHLLGDAAIDGRFGAAWAFGRLRCGDDNSLEVLERGLDDSDADVRSEVARALGRIGPPAARLAPQLERLLGDADPLVREEASRALAGFGRTGTPVSDGSEEAWLAGAPTVEELIERLETGTDFERAEAPWLLAKHGPRAAIRATQPLAAQALTDRDSDARWSALRTLGRIGEPSRELTVVLTQALAHDPDVRAAAAEALARWMERRDEVAPALRRALEDEDVLVREEAAAALAALSTGSDRGG